MSTCGEIASLDRVERAVIVEVSAARAAARSSGERCLDFCTTHVTVLHGVNSPSWFRGLTQITADPRLRDTDDLEHAP